MTRFAGIVLASLSLFSPSAYACTKTGEQSSGFNKICTYRCIDGVRSITISVTGICPISISYHQEQDERSAPVIISGQLLDRISAIKVSSTKAKRGPVAE